MPQPLPDDSRSDEAALVAAARGGSTQALGALFGLHARAVHATAYRPRQNVLGGYGAVGSWVRRSVPVGQ